MLCINKNHLLTKLFPIIVTNQFLPQRTMNLPHKIHPKNNDLNLIYAYYCRINSHKMKHKHFDELTLKTEAMDLHQFMTFSKDASLNAKRNKNHASTQQLQVLKQSSIHIERSKQNRDRREDIQQAENEQQQTKQNRKSQILKDGIKTSSHRSKKEVKTKHKPNFYLDQRKIAQIFKQYSSPEGELNFKGFQNVLKTIAQEMYKPKQSQKAQKNAKQKNKKNQSKEKNEFIEQDAFKLLLQFLKLDTKENVFEFYKKINEQHGNLDYLTLLRSPIKKIQVKNDPLGKYAGKQNTHHSRLIETVNSRKKIIKKKEKTLPSLQKDNKSIHIAYLISSTPAYQLPNHADIQAFLNYHRSQIEVINKNYESSSRVRTNKQQKNLQEEQQTLQNNIAQLKTSQAEKKQKTYSQRHKIKIIGQATKADLGRLIDVSDLYNDQIFNKYLQINHSPKNRNSKQAILNSKLHKYK